MSSEEIIKKFDETGAIPYCYQPYNVIDIACLLKIDRKTNEVILSIPPRIDDATLRVLNLPYIRIAGNNVKNYIGILAILPNYPKRNDKSIDQEVFVDHSDYKLYTHPYNIYESPNGTKYKVVVSDDGTLSTEKITS